MTDRTVKIGNYTSTALNLIFHSLVISKAEAKTNKVDLPGSDGVLDLTEIYGDVYYKERTITMGFWIDPTVFDSENTPLTVYSAVLAAWNGDKHYIRFSSDSTHYYTGRCTVGDLQQNGGFWGFNVIATVEPYKTDSDGNKTL